LPPSFGRLAARHESGNDRGRFNRGWDHSVSAQVRMTARRARLGRRLATALLGLAALGGGLAACAMRDLPIVGISEPRAPGEFSTSAAKHVFATGLDNIDKVYIEPVQISAVALHGLQAVSSVDPAFRVDRIGDSVKVTEGTLVAASFVAPADHDSDGWAAVLAGALEAGRSKSEKLRAASVETLYQTVFEGSLHDLDRFSRYAGASAAQDNRASRDGFGGVGIEVRVADNVARVAAVIPDTPAAHGGLLAGDNITQVDATPLVGMDERAVISIMRGPEGTDVTLTVVREAKPPFQVTLRRAKIVAPTITYRREGDDIAYFQISGFNGRTAETLRALVLRAKSEIGRKLRGVVLDLRNNPGGYLDQGIGVADLFLDSGRILTTRGRHPDSLQVFDATKGDIIDGLPIALLMNGGSASSSEIVAAALQDLGRAVVIGSSSYGKGTVQVVIQMPNNGELTLTWAKLYAPSGYALQRLGVIPNVCTSRPAATAAKSIADLRAGTTDPVAPLSARRTADGMSERDQLALAATCPTQTSAKGDDIDLAVARGVLSDPALIARSLHGSSVAAAR
jgi:carboxyl-terminal processing protease